MSKPQKHYGAWRARWTDEHGERHIRSFLEQKEASIFLAREKLRIREVRLGLRAPSVAPKTFDHAADYWEAHRAPRKRSRKDDLSILKQLREEFAGIGLNDTPALVAAVDRYVARKAHLDDKTVANHLTLLGTILRVAQDLGWLERLPRIKKPRVRLITADFSYLRTDDERARFLRAALEEGQLAYALYATAIYTGMRAGELAALQWADVDFDQRLITVQRSFDGPTKSSDVRYVPILDPLLPLLRRWRLTHSGTLVFTNRDGRMLGKSARVFQEVLHRVLERAGFAKVTRKGKQRWYICFHSLRHTFASHWVMAGGGLYKLRSILGHKSITLTERYAHLQPSAFREDYGRLGSAVNADGVVEELRPRAATAT